MTGLSNRLICHIIRHNHTCSVPKISRLYQPLQVSQRSAKIENASQLLVNNGLVHQSSTGLFSLLPLCQRALNKICCIVDQHMQEIGANEISLPILTQAELWEKTGRRNLIGSELMTVTDRHGKKYILSPTHEEAVCQLLSEDRSLSYNRLPLKLYQTTTKFRDEKRPCKTLLRSREFLMKDLYTFDIDKESAAATYDMVTQAYDRIFTKLGVPFQRVQGSCGAVGGAYSHEYHYEASAGQDELLYCGQCHKGANKDWLVETEQSLELCHNCGSNKLRQSSAIEVGHTFLLGDHYSRPMEANYRDKKDRPKPLVMGCYGLGLSRLLQAAIEVTSIEEGANNNAIVWPWHFAPYKLCIIGPKRGSREVEALPWVDALADQLSRNQLADDVIVDDRDSLTIGVRLHEARRSGYPLILVVGKAALEPVPKFELVDNTRRFRSVANITEEVAEVDSQDMSRGGAILTQLQLMDTVDRVCRVMR